MGFTTVFNTFWLFGFILCHLIYNTSANMCEESQGEKTIIVDISESRGDAYNQSTIPSELPIIGDPDTEITLELADTKQDDVKFTIEGKKLKLLKPIDRDNDNFSHVTLKLNCTVRTTNEKRTLPIIVRVADINDNPPVFITEPHEVTISELTPVGTVIFTNFTATDKDTGVNGLINYSIVPGNKDMIDNLNAGVGRNRITTEDGYSYFSINLPYEREITVNRSLDYERIQRFLVTILASDQAKNPTERFTSTTTLTVNIKDDDDQNPSFIYKGCTLYDGSCIDPEYSATVSSGILSGILNIFPEKIQAIDMDSINNSIQYSFVDGDPQNYEDYFEINKNTGAVSQKKKVTTVIKSFDITVKAEEKSKAKRSSTAKLRITVKPVDSYPPEVTPSAIEGFVDENSPIGTLVVDRNGKPIVLTVSDKDLGPNDPKGNYTFELTTNSFKIDENGYLIVNEKNLDRDSPSIGHFRFQIVARENNESLASSPISLVVYLNDINDNKPDLQATERITIEAGDGTRQITKVIASDNDEGKNAEITYSISHVSNNGQQIFEIDPKTGVINAVGKINAGQIYAITVQATDGGPDGGKSSKTIIEVNVVQRPNTQSPIFQRDVYDFEISEGVAINTFVGNITAIDPENNSVSYSIVSGNDLRQFTIVNGVITVIRKLDREHLTQYQLVVRANDSDNLSSKATVNIKVTDINDNSPKFVNLPYDFEVNEGEARKIIGRVHAEDADEGINAKITYLNTSDVAFTVDSETGDILTSIPLDYEQNHEYTFTVIAKDNGAESHTATATVTVKVIDVQDEVPIFQQRNYTAKIKENLSGHVVTQVSANDPDTKKQITYEIKKGDTDLFRINPQTGEITTKRGLDYETNKHHVLTIGTVENTNNDLLGATTRVDIDVEDENDNSPVLESIPNKLSPINLSDDSQIGTVVAKFNAVDFDRTTPGNQVQYELIENSPKFFKIDKDTGVLMVQGDLKKIPDSKYQVRVRAYDLGEPRLESNVISVTFNINHSVTVTPEIIGVGFSDDFYDVEIPEDIENNTLIKSLSIINSHYYETKPYTCKITDGNENNLFEVVLSPGHDCDLKLKNTPSDNNTTKSYQIYVQLESTSASDLTFHRNMTVVNIQIDNNNKPEFIYPEDPMGLRKKRYFASIPFNAHPSYPVLTVKCSDKDNGKFGELLYKILDENVTKYFEIDQTNGLIKTIKTFDDIQTDELPFKFYVQVQDNPNSMKKYNIIKTSVIVNLIKEENYLVLSIKNVSRELIQNKTDNIIRSLEDRSGLLIDIYKIVARKSITKNGTIQTHSKDTDVWFYAVDPKTESILDRNNSLLIRAILEQQAMTNILSDIAISAKVEPIDIHGPVVKPDPIKNHTITTPVAYSASLFPYALIIIAFIILILGIAGIIYICISWSRYKAYKDRMQRMYVVPKYDPVFVETDLKEYETQVLRMSVPNDDNDSCNDLQLDFSNKNHAFSMDNVSYITKDHGGSTGQQSPVSSEAATTVRTSSAAWNHPNMSTLGRKNNNTIDTPVLNPLFNHDDLIRASPSNDNVIFREGKDFSHLGFSYLNKETPIETSTEL